MDESRSTGDLQSALRQAATLLRGDPAAAAVLARAIVAEHPSEPGAGVLLASAERLSGRCAEALEIVSAIVDSNPGLGIALEELGMSLSSVGRWAEAENALDRAVAADGRLAGAWLALAELRSGYGDSRGGAEAYRRYVELTGDNLALIKAADALLAGNLGSAEQLCRDTLRRRPRDVFAMRMLADIGVQLGRLDDAELLLTYCLELAPDFHRARNSYANLLFRQQRIGEALAQIERLLIAEPDHPSHLSLKASILAQIGAAGDAVAIYQSVLQQHPYQARLHLSMSHALKTMGRQSEAVAGYRKVLELEPNLGEAYWSLANLKTFEFSESDIAGMRTSLDSDSATADDVLHLSFALGKALEDAGDYDEAFRHYANGNAARRRGVNWDADAYHADIEKLVTFFDPEFFESKRGSGIVSSAPIFIVGLPRAGSTLLEQILASHSQVEGTMELPDIMAMVGRFGGRGSQQTALHYPEVLAGLGRDELEALGSEYLERTAIHRSGAVHFVDKMPNNFAHVGFIHLILPQATIIDARRHPMACGFSVFKQLFAHGQNFSYSLQDVGRYYRDYVRLMSHWDRVLPGRICRVHYEAIVENTEDEVRRLLACCGLTFEPACLDFHRTRRVVRTASSEQVRQPIYKDAVEQWRNFEAHLAPLAEALGPLASNYIV